MAAHSTLAGGSIIERRMKCLPSYKLEAAAPEPPASKYAIEGTMLHSVIQRCVDEDIDPVKLTGYAEEGAVMTADLAVEMVAPALALLEQLLDAYGVDEYEIITEARVRYNGLDAFGTCDLLISTARFVFIVDWKFGRGVVVPGGPSNKQLRFYAGAAMETVPEYFEGGKEIVLAIIQPAADEPLTHGVIEREVLEDWIYWWLRRRDVSQYNPAKPPMTAAKIQMIEASKSPIDEIYEHLVENMEGDIATRKQVTVHVKRVARALGFDQIEGSPQNAVRRIWRQMSSLQPTNRNGYRVKIDTVREEVRAIRCVGDWISQTPEQIVDEMRKNSDTVVNMKISS